LDRIQDFLRLPSLAASQIRGFESRVSYLLSALLLSCVASACDARPAFSKTPRLVLRLATICFINRDFSISTVALRPPPHSSLTGKRGGTFLFDETQLRKRPSAQDQYCQPRP
jgi:hypothetical protein